MKTLGLLGGTSWHSTIEYYRYINQYVNDHFGDNTNPPLLIYNLNQSKIHRYQIESNWGSIADLLIEGARSLENAGVDRLMFCANTPHKVYEIVADAIKTPIIHIADATAQAIKAQNLSTVCFLGTKYSMIEDFITRRIEANGLKVLTPSTLETIDELHRIIQKELTYGNIISESKAYVIRSIDSMIDKGAEGVILGCTEFPLMLDVHDLNIPIFNTTKIHALMGAKFILGDAVPKGIK